MQRLIHVCRKSTWVTLRMCSRTDGRRFKRALRGDPPTRIEALCPTLRPGARAVKAHTRIYSPVKTTWIVACMVTLATLGLVFLNAQAVWASAAMAVRKKGGNHLVSD